MPMTYTIAIIGARKNSSLKDKNIRPLAGLPLLAYSIRAAKMTPNIQRTIVSTDSEEYVDVALKYGAEVFLRPSAFATDDAEDYAYVRHALDRCKYVDPVIPHLAVILRPTTPIRDPLVLRSAVDFVINGEGDYTSMRSVHPATESAYKQFETANGLLVPLGSETIETANRPRQKVAPTYVANGYVDIVSPKFVLETGTLYGDKVFAYQTPIVREVDTEEDFRFLEYQTLHDLTTARMVGELQKEVA